VEVETVARAVKLEVDAAARDPVHLEDDARSAIVRHLHQDA
jgi:hypothetical protein